MTLNGEFCWTELLVTQNQLSQVLKFYQELFPWSVVTSNIPGGGHYNMFYLKNGKKEEFICAISETSEHNIPSGKGCWQISINVDDLEKTATNITANGGKIIVPPMDVMNYGKMAVAAGVEGASFGLWQGKDFHGYGVQGKLDTVCWHELMTHNVQASCDFFTKIFGWKYERFAQVEEDYRLIFNVGMQDSIGGISIWKESPALWTQYFTCNNMQGFVAQVKKLGGKLLGETVAIKDIGTIALFEDPSGAWFGMLQPEM